MLNDLVKVKSWSTATDNGDVGIFRGCRRTPRSSRTSPAPMKTALAATAPITTTAIWWWLAAVPWMPRWW
ncbi:hypothetical protein H2136_21810 [Aeromonas hydrophila]|uniref:Uncharacterized protein n=1 Tax=Aeromonas hydrophila TaxID=644 RepID=A0A926FPD2_AERHY|nr:hypothetical protein [Aeromonas hydrophila]